MQSVSVGFPVRTSRHASVVRRIAAALVLVSGSLFLLAGCDSESLETSTANQQARALSALGSGASLMAHADVHTLLNESGPFMELLPEDVRISFRTRLVEAAGRMGLDPYEDIHGLFLAVNDGTSSGTGMAPEMAAIFFADLTDVPFPAELEEMRSGDAVMHLNRYKDEAVIMATTESWMQQAVESLDLKGAAHGAFPDILSEVESSDAWIVFSDVDVLAERAGADLGQYGAILNQIDRVAGGVVLQDGVLDIRVLAEPSATTTAEDLASVARAAKALLRMQNDVPEYIVALSERISIEERRERVLLSMRIDVELAQTLMEKFDE